jgi:uncharacterized membrane protein YuzA (DUF378 family)
METKNIIITLAYILTAIGAINWGLTTIGTNLVSDLLPRGMQKIIFAIIGLSGIIVLYKMIQKIMMKKDKKDEKTEKFAS